MNLALIFLKSFVCFLFNRFSCSNKSVNFLKELLEFINGTTGII